MPSALGMQLDTVRTVLKNEACEVAVCADHARDDGALFTVVTLFSPALGKALAGRIALEGLFAENGDFVGSFMHKNNLNLVFRYQHEQRLTTSRQIYTATFARRKEIAVSFLSALAETGLTGDIGALLVDPQNVNISGDRIYLNYFLDFDKLPEKDADQRFFSDAAQFAFVILSWDYAERFGSEVDKYPSDLRLIQKKAQRGSFRSFSQIIAAIRALPDELRPQRQGFARILNLFDGARRYLSTNATRAFMTVLVIVTLVFLAWQVGIRISANVGTRNNSVYAGMENIGEIHLGEEYY